MNIFPEGSLSVSLITTVWAGLFVICFFNLRLGWTISGLIVPGYLAPLLILKPWSAVAVIIEAVFTYLAVIGFSRFGEKTGLYSEVFGRDRFFFILLLSVAMRLLFDDAVFPWFTSILSQHLEIEFLYRDGLYSIGLVIVALTANQFWTSGLRRGLFQLAVTLTITFLIIKYILIGYTNFRLNELANVYENLATSILASPKAYIILLTTAFIASRMNLLYGWEFSGIAIPALLALLWYKPQEILISVAEAVIIYFIASLLLRTKFFSKMSIEGARKILFFFNIAFFYKLVLGFILPLFLTNIAPNDYYGFGYMLTSLIAIKMHDKGFGARIIGSTVITSAISIAAATLIGFSLTFLSKNEIPQPSPHPQKTIEMKTQKAWSNIPIRYSTGKPLPLLSSPFEKIEIKSNNRKLGIDELRFIDETIFVPLFKLSETSDKNLSTIELIMNKAAKAADYPGIKIMLFGNKAFSPDFIELKSSLESGSAASFYLRFNEGSNILLESDCHSIKSLCLMRLIESEFKPKVILLNGLFSRGDEGTIETETAKTYVKSSLFDLFNQISMREMDKLKDNLNIILVKTAPKKNNLNKNFVYVSSNTGAYSPDTLNEVQQKLINLLVNKSYSVKFVNGLPETSGLETDNLLSSRYLPMTKNTSMIVLWVSE
ncbi:MAG TPA: hypothetical protein DD381_03485 [Lentisphaeria bacterium]|nr:MAG: hypothetical protein A2X47_02765 [Lentisphaerae bacterium GWF2_38_69]HBM15395.1 hypothetical protein [Lentisphaeria bacterium]